MIFTSKKILAKLSLKKAPTVLSCYIQSYISKSNCGTGKLFINEVFFWQGPKF